MIFSIISRAFTKAAEKVITAIRHPRQFSWLDIFLPNTNIDFEKHVGNGIGSNVFVSPLLWIWRASLESRWVVVRENDKGIEEFESQHDIIRLLQRPNPFTTGAAMRLAILISWFADGNVYLLKARDRVGRVRQLWYVPHWMVEPKWDEDDDSAFVSHYAYKPGGTSKEVEIEPSEVVHLKHGVDPRNVRKGFSMLKLLLREVFNDDEAANFVAALLLNGGVPGLIISPKDSGTVSAEGVKATKDYIKVMFGRSKRGEPLALGAPTDVREFGYDPEKMNLSVVRNVSEERVCAALGVPAAVVGFGSGNESTKVGATLVELHRIAWIDCLIPNQELLAEEFTHALRNDFALSENERIGWDRRRVRALQEDSKKLAEQMDIAVRGGWAMVSEAREALELPTDDSHRIFLRPFGAIEVLANGEQKELPALPLMEPQSPKEMKAARLSSRQAAILRALDSIRKGAERKIAKRMQDFFRDMGDLAARQYLTHSTKALEDEIVVDNIFSGMQIPVLRSNLRGVLANSYAQVFSQTRSLLGKAGLGADLTDTVELEILSKGGTRAGLIDLTEKAREKAIKIIEDGREEGRNPSDIARDLAEAIPSGRYSTIKNRAEIVAKTESRVAQSESAVAVYRNSPGIRSVRIIDARLGDTDEDCEEINGQVISFDEAEIFIADEHPNGTRDFLPVFDAVPA